MDWTIVTALEAQRRDTLSARALVETCLERCSRHEPSIHAWVRLDADGALRAADQADAMRRAGGWLGPLHGIPLGVKDIIDIAGVPTECGSPLRVGRIATHDAPVVARLRAAGAILLGKTVTTEFAGFDPPATRNPWQLDRTPGGSSSGSAAAVALGMCLAALGSQTGGSIIRPASFCGVAGFKPAHRAYSLAGIEPISLHLDHPGPLARCVADLELLDAVLRDPQPPADWPDDWRADPDDGPLAGAPRLGVVGEFFETTAAPEVRSLTALALDRIRAAGATLEPAPLPASFADVHRLHRRIMAHDYHAGHGATFARQREQYGARVSEMIDEGSRVTPAEFAEALEHQVRFRADMTPRAAAYDALVMPSTVTTAPGRETTGDPRFNSPWSYAGLPSVTIPCGRDDEGLPAGLQFVGTPARLRRLFATAGWCESRLDAAGINL